MPPFLTKQSAMWDRGRYIRTVHYVRQG